MIKLLLLTLPFLVVYMAFAFVNWDIAWAAHVDMIARWFFYLYSCGMLFNVGNLLFT